MKICNVCKVEKRMPLTRATMCYPCYRKYDRERYYREREKRLLKDKKRYDAFTPEQRRENSKKQRERHPEHWKARQAVRNAITRGKLERLPCETCGDTPSHAHHHKGYSKENWLTVEWLCKQHHYEKHRKYKLGE